MKIIVNDKHIVDFISVSVNEAVDQIANTFSFSSFFDSQNETHLEIFKPYSYNKVKIYDSENNLMVNGVIINNSFSSSASVSAVNVSGYALTGVLSDVSIPLNMFPLQSDKRSLKEVIERYIKPFGIKFVVPAELNEVVNSKFNKTTSEVGEKLADYFIRLAIQKNLILKNDVNGNLTILKLNDTVKWRFVLEENIEMNYSIDTQNIHSEIGVIRQRTKKQGGGSLTETIKNPLITEYRPIVKKLSNSEDTNMNDTKKAILASEMDGIELTINKAEWIDTLRAGDTIEVLNPECFLFEYTKFIIKSISGSADSNSSVMSLSCVLPEALIR